MSETQEQVIKASELDNYDFGKQAPPEGYDPNAEGFENTPPGWHIFELIDFSIKPDHTFKNKNVQGGQWVGNQLRPRLRVKAGEKHAGTTQMDFLPMPTPGRPMPKEMANQWCNFLRSFGFKMPADSLVPAGFKLHDLLNGNEPGKPPTKSFLTCRCEIVKREYEGTNGPAEKIGPRFFGYKKVNDDHEEGNGVSKTVTARPSTPNVDLDNL